MNSSLTSQVLEKSDIIEVIQSYGIKAFKAGKNYKALCPFHNDSNPSMSISPEKQIFKCFSCGIAGNAIDFVLQYENKVNNNMSFKRIDAIKKVAEICNINIDIDNVDIVKDSDYLDSNQRYIAETNKSFNRIFTYYLNQTETGKKALEYLHQRGLSDKIISDLELGYCSENTALLNDKNFDNAQYVGLAKKSEDRRYEVMRNRIIFPIKNDKGDIVGFSGRILSREKSNIKYLNTEENSLFKKGTILYNFNDAKKYIKNDGIYITEGYMDVIAAKMIGLHNTCALMGTALTDAHIELLKNTGTAVNLMLDTDFSGREATAKIIDQLEKNGIDVNIVDLKKLGKLKDLGEYYEFVIKNTDENKIAEKLGTLKSEILKSKEKPIVFKVKRYLENMELNDLNLVNIEDIYRKFKSQLKGSNLTSVIEYIRSNSHYSESEIQEILNPVNKNYSNFLSASINKALDDILINEISKSEDNILKKYYQQNKKNILEQANILLQEDGGYLYQDGEIVGHNLLNSLLRNNKSYEKFKKIYAFKYQSLFDKCYISNNGSSNKISLSKADQYQFVEKYNDTFKNDELKDKNNITEAYVIDKIDDLFDILPVKMMNQFQFKDIQKAFYDKKVICFDFNTIFDSMQIKMGMLNYFDKSFKADDSRLKAILIYPNQDKSINIQNKTLTKEVENKEKLPKKENQDKTTLNYEKNTTENYINVFSSLIKKETQKGFYFKAGRNNERYYFAPKEICQWYGNDKKTFKISLKNINKLALYSYYEENKKFVFKANATYSQIEKDFKVFKSSIKEKANKTSYMVFKEYDVDSIEKNGVKYAVISIPYKDETATMMIPFSYKYKETEGMIYFKVQSNWTYNINLNGIKEKKTPDEIMKIYNQNKDYEYEIDDKKTDINTIEDFERSVAYG